jgi:pyruvate ferredoxin oxidoreductase delta subunit
MSGHVSEIAMSKPSAGEAGATGDWRSKRPVMDATLCLAVKAGKETCQICWAYCPDACIARGIGPVIDLTYCKGCGICAEVCPAGCIAMVPEAEHGVCEI